MGDGGGDSGVKGNTGGREYARLYGKRVYLQVAITFDGKTEYYEDK